MPATETMTAVVKSGAGIDAVRLSRIPAPRPGPGQAVVSVIAAGICGTDLHIVRDEYPNAPPVVLGHEVTGTVTEVGDTDDRHWLGRRVALETYAETCRSCEWCRSERPNLCPERRSIGSFADGGFAERVVVPASNLHEVPGHVPALEGALLEPLACVARCLLDPARVRPGDRVLVTGPGTMGQLAARVARARGAKVTLAGLDRDRARLDVAGAAGIATTTEAPSAESCDLAIEASGSVAGLRAAYAALRRGGHLVQMGIVGAEALLDVDQVLYKELTVSSGFASTPRSWRAALALVADPGAAITSGLVTGAYPLGDWRTAVGLVASGDGIKTVLTPNP